MALEVWPEEPSTFDDVFRVELDLCTALSGLELVGGAVWDERKGFWSPAPGLAPRLRSEGEDLLSGSDPSFLYLDVVREILDCQVFWASFEELAPGTAPVISPAKRGLYLRRINRARAAGQLGGES